jgi:hypothetical protein
MNNATGIALVEIYEVGNCPQSFVDKEHLSGASGNSRPALSRATI